MTSVISLNYFGLLCVGVSSSRGSHVNASERLGAAVVVMVGGSGKDLYPKRGSPLCSAASPVEEILSQLRSSSSSSCTLLEPVRQGM